MNHEQKVFAIFIALYILFYIYIFFIFLRGKRKPPTAQKLAPERRGVREV
jgi:hypothetical protein